MESVVTEGNVRTIEKVSERTVNNKTVIQRTATTNSTQVNKYDADGNLKSTTELEKESWEERDTKNYEWSKPADRPPTPPATDGTVAVTASDLSVEKFLQEGPPSDGATIVMTTTEQVPGVKWSGTTVEQNETPVVTAAEGVPIAAITAAPSQPASADGSTAAHVASTETGSTGAVVGTITESQASQRTTTNLQGESSSRSGEVVWITETTKKSAGSTPEAGVHVDLSTSGSNHQAAILPATVQSPAVVNAVPVASTPQPATQPSTQQLQQPQPLSVEERRRKRCLENRARKAAVESAGTALTSA